jgi:hypothetical protein
LTDTLILRVSAYFSKSVGFWPTLFAFFLVVPIYKQSNIISNKVNTCCDPKRDGAGNQSGAMCISQRYSISGDNSATLEVEELCSLLPRYSCTLLFVCWGKIGNR